MDIPGPTNVVEMPPGLPFEQKWEFLRPHIEQLYIHENCKLPDVIKTLKGRFGFDAT